MSADLLEQHVAALASASSPSELFRALLEASAIAAPRAGVLLQRQGRMRGWGSRGGAAAAAAAFRTLDLPADAGWIAQAVEAEGSSLLEPSPLGAAGGPAAEACLAVPVRAGGRVVALLVAERLPAGPWRPEMLALLGTVASLRLELDLARRRLAAHEEQAARVEPELPSPPAPPSPPSPPPEPTPAPSPRAATPAPEPTGLAPVAARPEPAPEQGRRDEARRFARLVATDIRLYNEESVVLGRRQGDLLRRLQDPLARGRETFVRRFGDLGDDGLRLLHEAYVEVLAAGDEALLPYHALRPTRP